MILKNFYNIQAAYALRCPVKLKSYQGNVYDHYKNNYSGGPTLYDGGYSGSMTNVLTNADKGGSSGGVLFGTGNTAPTVDDYKLAGNIISGLSVTTVATTGEDENGIYREVTYTITNGNSNDVTIAEVGLTIIGHFGSSGQNSYSYRYSALVERTVLDYPVTIAATAIGQVKYRVYCKPQTIS